MGGPVGAPEREGVSDGVREGVSERVRAAVDTEGQGEMRGRTEVQDTGLGVWGGVTVKSEQDCS